MGIDRTGGAGTGVETVEDQQPADRPPPPPPPDQPGAEPEGVPSRADSRAAAAAANKPDTTELAEETRQEQGSAVADDKPESSPPEPEPAESNESTSEPTASGSQDASHDHPDGSNQGAVGERDAPQEPTAAEIANTDEQPSARDDQTEAQRGAGVTGAFDGSAEQQPSTLVTSSVEDTSIDDESAPAQAATAETADRPAPMDRGDTDVVEPSAPDTTAEATETQPADDLTPRPDVPQPQPEGVPPQLDGPADSDQANDAPQADLDTTPAAETPDQQSTDDWPWADEFAARAQARENAAATNAEQTDDASANKPAVDASSEPHDAVSGVPEPSDSHEEPDQPRIEDAPQKTDLAERPTETPGEESRPGAEFMVGDKLVRIRDELDPARAEDWSNEVGDQPTDPTDRAGDRIVQPENDRDTRAEKFRRKTYEVGDDVLDKVKEGSNRAQDLFPPRPPTGHPETRTTPVAIPDHQHEAINAGDTATALITAGLVMIEFYRWGRGKLAKKKGA